MPGQWQLRNLFFKVVVNDRGWGRGPKGVVKFDFSLASGHVGPVDIKRIKHMARCCKHVIGLTM